MKLAGKVWNTLNLQDRETLLREVWSKQELIDIEKKRKWEGLLLSTQGTLLDLDFSTILGKNVQP